MRESKNCFKEPVCDAVVELVEIVYDCGKKTTCYRSYF